MRFRPQSQSFNLNSRICQDTGATGAKNLLEGELEATERSIQSLLKQKEEIASEIADLHDNLFNTEFYEARLIEYRNSATKLRETEGNLKKLRSEVLRVKKLRQDFEHAEKRSHTSENEYRRAFKKYAESEIAFHREQAGLLAQTQKVVNPALSVVQQSTHVKLL